MDIEKIRYIDETTNKQKGIIYVDDIQRIDKKDEVRIHITIPNRTYFLRFENPNDTLEMFDHLNYVHNLKKSSTTLEEEFKNLCKGSIL